MEVEEPKRKGVIAARLNALRSAHETHRRLLIDAFYALRGIDDPGSVGSGFDPSVRSLQPGGPLVPDSLPAAKEPPEKEDFLQVHSLVAHVPTIEEVLSDAAAFQDINESGLRAIPSQLPELPRTPPRSPTVHPVVVDVDMYIEATSECKAATPPADPMVKSAYPRIARVRLQDERRSPSFQKQCLPEISASTHPQPVTVSLSDLSLGAGNDDRKKDGRPTDDNTGHPILSEAYVECLPPLPNDLLRNRLLMGGLMQKRAKEREKASVITSGGSELYKLGLVKSQRMSVRRYLGAGPAQEAQVRKGNTPLLLMTNDWDVGFSELRTMRAMERIEELKAEKRWSFRQPKKQRGPNIPRAHWDHLLEEMRWLQTDFRQERRWKLAMSYNLGREVLKYHATDKEVRKDIGLCVRSYMPQSRPLTDADVEMDLAVTSAEPEVARPTQPDVELAKPTAGHDADAEVDAEAEETHPNAPPVEVGQRYIFNPQTATEAEAQIVSLSNGDMRWLLRRPIFDVDDNTGVVNYEDLPLYDKAWPYDTPEGRSSDLLSKIFYDLPLYQGLVPIAPGSKADRRLDESTQQHSRISQASKWFSHKPVLLSALEPTKRRKQDTWADMSDLLCDDPIQFEVRDSKDNKPDYIKTSCELFSGRKPKEVSHAIQIQAPPVPIDIDQEQRAAQFNWSAEQDNLILSLSKQFPNNWGLIADNFNAMAVRVLTDKRLPWDIYYRWREKFGQSPPTHESSISGPPSSAAAADAKMLRKDVKKTPTRLEMPRRKPRRAAIHDSIRQLQKMREAAAKNPVNAPRKSVNLTSHESHAVIIGRTPQSPLQLSQDKAERDQQRTLSHNLLRQQQQLVNAPFIGRHGGSSAYSQARPQQMPIQIPHQVRPQLPLMQQSASQAVSSPSQSPPHQNASTNGLVQRTGSPLHMTPQQQAALTAHLSRSPNIGLNLASLSHMSNGQATSVEQAQLLQQRQLQAMILLQQQQQQAAQQAASPTPNRGDGSDGG